MKINKRASELNSGDDVVTVDKSSDEDEESFLLYVKTNFEPVYKKFKEENTIECYYCDFLPRSKKLRDLEDEMRIHLLDNHKDVTEDIDFEKDTFDDEYHQDFLGLFTDDEWVLLPLHEGPLHRVLGLPPHEAQYEYVLQHI